MSFTVIVSFQAKPEHVETMMGFLKDVQPQIIKAGCKSITLLRDRENPNRLIEIEEWDSEEEQQKYVAALMESGAFDNAGDMLDGEPSIHILDALQGLQA